MVGEPCPSKYGGVQALLVEEVMLKARQRRTGRDRQRPGSGNAVGSSGRFSWGELGTWVGDKCLEGLEYHAQRLQGLPSAGALSHAPPSQMAE